MTDQEKTYPEIDRRKDCSEHCPYADQATKSTPRVYFLASWSALIVCAVAFVGWHESSMGKLKEENRMAIEVVRIDMLHEQLSHKKRMDEILAHTTATYSMDVERFIRATHEIREILSELGRDVSQIKVQNAEFKTKQDLVVKKIKLTE